MTTVLIVEDEKKIADILDGFLRLEGYKTHIIHDGLQVIDTVKRELPDFIILDLMLPNIDGLTLCKKIRQFSQIPILMLTARIDEIDRLMGLDCGADDYVCKPFLPREVVARVKAILRRGQHDRSSGDKRLIYQQITLDAERFIVTVADNKIELTPVEFNLLKTLISHVGKVQTREKLMQVCYSDRRIVSNRTIDSHIKNLRNKLGVGSELLHTIYGVGYKLE
jgi:two-component system response regulator BaeR